MDNAVFDRRGETTRLGSFEIVRKLARGGMAEIFLARTRGPSGFEKLVVLKKILPKYAGKRRFVQLFLEEAKLAAGLDHPNIAQVYDIGMVDGSYFFTMEYLHGQDLRSILHRAWRTGDRLPIENAVQVARNVASALHFAHEKQRSDGALLGIVHRDVSPSNVIVTYDGATKLLDFGVAKSTASTVKTRTGALKGKVSYMSPEQARGAPIDRRSDIFSLGVVLWEMVTVQRLYRGENDLATLQLIINQPPQPPTAIRRDCPAELERIVLRALAQDPTDRYQTADELGSELDELAREHKLKQTPSSLSATVAQLFGAELAAWREARAAGVQLADHINDVSGHTAPVHESDFIEAGASGDDDDDDDVDAPDGAEAADAAAGAADPGEAGRAPYDRRVDVSVDLADARSAADASDAAHRPRQLGRLYERDSSVDDDEEKTEHVPLFVEPLPSLTAEPPPEAVTTLSPAARHHAPTAPLSIAALHSTEAVTTLSPAARRSAPTVLPEDPLQADPVTTVSRAARHPTPNAPFAPARGSPPPAPRHPTPGVPFAPVPPQGSPSGPETLIGPFMPMPDAVPPEGGAPTLLGPMGCPPMPGVMIPGSGVPLAAGSVASGPLAGVPLAAGAVADPSVSVAALQGDGPTQPSVPSGMVSILPTQPSSPPPVIGPRVIGSPFPGASVSSTPFTVSPWRAGQPGAPPTERTRRSWAVIDLPALDPEVLARHRRIVLRVAIGLVALILLLAILAGHC
ncbi:MAG TPA: protein kinase [Kofleriaceae bacterium]|nr:protein kinase [Kofleriaceae bacterium]